jgi:hypothetical protein
MNVRIGLFLAATAIVANACTPRHQASTVADEPKPVESKPVDPITTPTPSAIPDAGALPDFSSASADVNQADVPTSDATNDDTNESTGIAPGLVPPNVNADDVREATFRHMFGKNASGQQNGSGVFCLAVESDQDPPHAFLMRFKNVKTPVRGQSECNVSAAGVVDKRTQKHGLVFRIDHIEFKDAKHATVHGGYFEAGLSASGNTYTLVHKANGWVVVKDEMNWIS